jgi:hypothetical protein
MACEGSSYTRTAKRSLGVYDLIAAAEWRELTSRYSALEQSDRTYGQSTQASATLHLPNKQGRLCQTPWRFTETPYKCFPDSAADLFVVAHAVLRLNLGLL